MNQLVQSEMCRSGKACRRCRTPAQNRWRHSLGNAYQLPGNDVSFPCPHGKPWRGTAPPVMPYVANDEPPAPLPAPPLWSDLRAIIASRWPDWLPEFDGGREDMTGCTNCQDTARRRRWAERVAVAMAL